MRRNFALALFLGSLLVAGCRVPSSSQAPGGGATNGPGATPVPTPPPAPTASLTVVDPGGGAGPFALADLEQLVVTVAAEHVTPGSHRVRVDVMSPGGKLYAQLPASLQASDTGHGTATATLQVRGSVIESYQDSGTWQFAANVDDTPLAAASVDLTE